MNFFESRAGYDLMTHHIPRLVNAVEKLAEQISARPPFPNISVPDRKNILRDFYRGYYQPGEYIENIQNPDYRVLTEELRIVEAKLHSLISTESWQLVEQYCDILIRRNGAELDNAFEAGFRVATQLIVAGLRPAKEDAQDEV